MASTLAEEISGRRLTHLWLVPISAKKNQQGTSEKKGTKIAQVERSQGEEEIERIDREFPTREHFCTRRKEFAEFTGVLIAEGVVHFLRIRHWLPRLPLQPREHKRKRNPLPQNEGGKPRITDACAR